MRNLLSKVNALSMLTSRMALVVLARIEDIVFEQEVIRSNGENF